jgi:hypothetical protein
MPLGQRFGWARRVSSGQNVARRAAPEANCHFFAQSTIAIRPAGSRPAGFYPPKLYIQCLRPNCHPAEPVVRSHLAPPERHVMRPLPLPAPSGNPSGRGFSLTGRDQYCSLWRDMQVVALIGGACSVAFQVCTPHMQSSPLHVGPFISRRAAHAWESARAEPRRRAAVHLQISK